MIKENIQKSDEAEVSLSEILKNNRGGLRLIWTNKFKILFLAILGAIIGFLYSSFYSKSLYIASMSFTLEQKNNSGGALGGLASSLGLGDLPTGSGSGMFGGENVLYLIKSNRIIHQSLKESQTELNGDNLLNFYLENHDLNNVNGKRHKIFPIDLKNRRLTREQDSIILVVSKKIKDSQIQAERLDKKTTIINLDITDINEKWAYLFSKALVKNAVDLYLDIKIGKLLRAEEELTKKRDSIRGLLDGSINSLAYETDMNSHTPLMRFKTKQVKKQIDVEVLKSMYANVIQNLEVTKIQRAQEEPIIEIIDEPILPLQIKKLGKIYSTLVGFVLFAFFSTLILILIKNFSKKRSNYR